MWEAEPSAMIARAERLRAEGRYEDAIAAFEDAMTRFPMLAAYRFVVAELCFELQRYPQAANIFAELVRREPQHVQAWAGLGRAAYLLGDEQNAILAFERAIGLSPEWAEPLYEAAIIYASRGDHVLAEDRLRRALVRDPKLAQAADDEGLLARYPGARA